VRATRRSAKSEVRGPSRTGVALVLDWLGRECALTARKVWLMIVQGEAI